MYRSNELAQATNWSFSSDSIKERNTGIRIAESSSTNNLAYPQIHHTETHLRCFADFSLVSNKALPSQIGFDFLLCDDNNNCHILELPSSKSRWVVKSAMTQELHAFAEASDSPSMTTRNLKNPRRQAFLTHVSRFSPMISYVNKREENGRTQIKNGHSDSTTIVRESCNFRCWAHLWSH